MHMSYQTVPASQSAYGYVYEDPFIQNQYSKQQLPLSRRRLKKNPHCCPPEKRNNFNLDYQKPCINCKNQFTAVPSVNQTTNTYSTRKSSDFPDVLSLSNSVSLQSTQGSAHSPFCSGCKDGCNNDFVSNKMSDQKEQEPYSSSVSTMTALEKSPIPKTPGPFMHSSNAKNERKSCTTTPSTTASGVHPQKLKSMKLQFYRTKMCPWVITSGHCRKDSSCRYAHFIEELRPLPDLSKTKMCEDLIKSGRCNYPATCNYAHSIDELRATQSFNKTKLCPVWIEQGYCLAGKSCRFAHGEIELRNHQNSNDNASTTKQTSSSPPSLPTTPQRHCAQPSWPPFSTGFDGSQWNGRENVCANQFLHQVSPVGLRMANGLVYVQSHVAQKSPSVADKQTSFDVKWHGEPQEETYAGTPGGDVSQVLTHLLPSGIFTPMTNRQANLGGASIATGNDTMGPWGKPSPAGEVPTSPPIYYAATVYTQPTLLSAAHFTHASPAGSRLVFPTAAEQQEGTPLVGAQNVLVSSVNRGAASYQTTTSPAGSPVSVVATTPAGNWTGQFLQLPVLQTPLTTKQPTTSTFAPFPTQSDSSATASSWGKPENRIQSSPVSGAPQYHPTVFTADVDITTDVHTAQDNSQQQTDVSPSVFSFKSDRCTSVSHDQDNNNY